MPRPPLQYRSAPFADARYDVRRSSRPKRLLAPQPFAEEADLRVIGSPHYVEGIAEDRYRAYNAVERDICKHTRNDVQRRAQLTRLMHDVERDRGGDRIANAGNEPDDRIEAESNIGAGKNELRGQHRRQRLRPRRRR